MLEHLYIKNLAVVPELEIEFGSGFNVITGETGAGKSLILGALELLMGERASKSVIRSGATQCEISSTIHLSDRFSESREDVKALLEEFALPPLEDNRLLLRRVISKSGTRSFVNSSQVTLDVLSNLGNLLIAVHGPNQNHTLLLPGEQVKLLDLYAGNTVKATECENAYRDVEIVHRKLENLKNTEHIGIDADFLNFQIKEIRNADLQPGEDQEISRQHALAAHAQTLIATAGQCMEGLVEGDGAIVDQLSQFIRLMEEIRSIDTKTGGVMYDQLDSIVEQIHELGHDLENYASSLEFDPDEFTRLEDRLGIIQKLKRKYGPEIEDILRTADELEEKLAELEGRGERITELESEYSRKQHQFEQQCKQVTELRKKASSGLAKKIAAKLGKLGFNKSLFEVRVLPGKPGPGGADHVEFCFSPNPGEKVQPLRNIASSGETARVMLAIKTVLTEEDSVPILVFDEVDANIGGRVAVRVASELAAIGQRHQTLCISHLAQIAAAGDLHYKVLKEVVGDRTITQMEILDGDGRRKEIARMLGAEESSSVALDHADELLAQAAER